MLLLVCLTLHDRWITLSSCTSILHERPVSVQSQWKKGVPVEVVPMAYQPVMNKIEKMGFKPTLRMAKAKAVSEPDVIQDTSWVFVDNFYKMIWFVLIILGPSCHRQWKLYNRLWIWLCKWYTQSANHSHSLLVLIYFSLIWSHKTGKKWIQN